MAMATQSRSQFSTGSRHLPIAQPFLDGRLNHRLWTAAGLSPPRSRPPEVSEQAAALLKQPATATTVRAYTGDPYRRPGGAGTGTLAGVASTMNSVVALMWSPSAGMGATKRPLLGVLSNSGVLAVYGTHDDKKNNNNAHWQVLWGVGERLLVPPQTKAGECVTSFAWGPLWTDGQSKGVLLVYANDEDEVAVLSVSQRDKDDNNNDDDDDKIEWLVSEVARFQAVGPHPLTDRLDPDYVPTGSSFRLQCSPCVQQTDDRGLSTYTFLIGYLAHNYLGFRRVTLSSSSTSSSSSSTSPAAPSSSPLIHIDDHDVDGLCVFLGVDAFLVWESGIWTRGSSRVCRGVVTTPMVAKPFEVTVIDDHNDHAPLEPPCPPHSVASCGTTYPAKDDNHTNPIMDLVILPPDLSTHSLQPRYAFVRQSVTATNDDWYAQVDGFGHPDPPRRWPAWTAEIAHKARLCVGEEDYGDVGAVDEDDDDDEEEEEEDMQQQDPMEIDVKPPIEELTTPEKPRYAHRYRLWGLAVAPGIRSVADTSNPHGLPSTAALVTEHPAQHPDRGGWFRHYSRVVFGWTAPTVSPFTPADDDGDDDDRKISEEKKSNYTVSPPSAEARLWSWMYSGGPSIPVQVGGLQGKTNTQTQPQERAVFASMAATQTCVICASPIRPTDNTSDPATTACAKGHLFDLCGTTGLAIQQPGISRACGVCGRRTMRAETLRALLRGLGREGTFGLGGDLCGRCGGKFK